MSQPMGDVTLLAPPMQISAPAPSPFVRYLIRCASGEYVNPAQVFTWGIYSISEDQDKATSARFAIVAVGSIKDSGAILAEISPATEDASGNPIAPDLEQTRRAAQLVLDLLIDMLLAPTKLEQGGSPFATVLDMRRLVIEVTGLEAADTPGSRPAEEATDGKNA